MNVFALLLRHHGQFDRFRCRLSLSNAHLNFVELLYFLYKVALLLFFLFDCLFLVHNLLKLCLLNQLFLLLNQVLIYALLAENMTLWTDKGISDSTQAQAAILKLLLGVSTDSRLDRSMLLGSDFSLFISR